MWIVMMIHWAVVARTVTLNTPLRYDLIRLISPWTIANVMILPSVLPIGCLMMMIHGIVVLFSRRTVMDSPVVTVFVIVFIIGQRPTMTHLIQFRMMTHMLTVVIQIFSTWILKNKWKKKYFWHFVGTEPTILPGASFVCLFWLF